MFQIAFLRKISFVSSSPSSSLVQYHPKGGHLIRPRKFACIIQMQMLAIMELALVSVNVLI